MRARAGRCWREVGGRVRSSPAAPCCGPAQERARCMHTGLVDRFLERRRRISRGARHQTSLAWTGRIVENGIQKRHTNRPCWTRSPGTGTPVSGRLEPGGTETRSGLESGKELGRETRDGRGGPAQGSCLRHRARRCTVEPSSV